MKQRPNFLRLATALFALGACAACGPLGQPARPAVAGGETRAVTPWVNARQMVVVISDGWDARSARLHRFERSADGWRATTPPAPVMLGRSGSAWGIGLHPLQSAGPQKREGDGRAPAGVFGLGTAFGYADSIASALPYEAMQATDYCVDVSGSPLYNRIVDARDVGQEAVAKSTEPMRLDLHNKGDPRYKLGLVIEHNKAGRAMGGSCIFAHLWKAPGETTAGCTAMAEPVMQQLVGWLDPRKEPVFVLLPAAEYARLREAWQLPTLPAG